MSKNGQGRVSGFLPPLKESEGRGVRLPPARRPETWSLIGQFPLLSVFSKGFEETGGRTHISNPSSAIYGVPEHWRALRDVYFFFFFWREGGGRAACSQSLPRHPSSLDGERRAQRVSRTCGICGSLMSQLSFIP